MKFLKKAFSWLKSTFGFGMGMIRDHTFLAVEITENLKALVRSPITRAVVSLTPFTWDDKIRTYADSIVLPILAEVAHMAGVIRENQKDSVAIEMIIARLKTLHPDEEAKVYQDFAARMNYRLADGVFSLKESWEAAQDTWYTFFKKK